MDLILFPIFAVQPAFAPFLLSEEDEDSGGSIADKGVASPKKDKDENKEADPSEILEEDDTGFPVVQEKVKTDPNEEKRMEEAL